VGLFHAPRASQKPHFARDGVARVLGLPQEKVYGNWVPGPGSYGRKDAGDAGIDAVLVSKAMSRPCAYGPVQDEGETRGFRLRLGRVHGGG